MAYVTPGGTTRLSGPGGPLPAATAITARLLVRQVGETRRRRPDRAHPRHRRPALRLHRATLRRRPLPAHRADRVPGARPHLQVRVEGGWAGDGRAGAVADTIRFRTAHVRRRGPPLATGARQVSAFRLSRLAVPLPPILPSLNQIGFDSYEMAIGALDVSPPDANGEGTVLLWAVSTKRAGNATVADRRGAFAFPLQGRYRHDSLLLSQRGLSLTFSFGDVPLRRFDLRMQLGSRPPGARREPDGRGVLPRGAGLRGGAGGDRPLQQRPHPPGQRHVHHRSLPRSANSRPRGVRVASVELDRANGRPSRASRARRCRPRATRPPSCSRTLRPARSCRSTTARRFHCARAAAPSARCACGSPRGRSFRRA